MPHAVLDRINSAVDVNASPRSLIPGVEPGGSRVGQPTKPALLIKEAYWEPQRAQILSGADTDFSCVISLKLSQELDLTPGLLLPVASFLANRGQGDATGSWGADMPVDQVFRGQGSIWAPRVVGVRLEFEGGGTFNQFSGFMHVDYERVDVPWMDWFLMWDFLDNIVDDEREY